MIISRRKVRARGGQQLSITIGRGFDVDEAEDLRFWQEEATPAERQVAVSECVREYYALRGQPVPPFRPVLRVVRARKKKAAIARAADTARRLTARRPRRKARQGKARRPARTRRATSRRRRRRRSARS